MTHDSDHTDLKQGNEIASNSLKLRTSPQIVTKKRRRRRRGKPEEKDDSNEEDEEAKGRFSLFGDPRERSLHFPMIDDVDDDLVTRNPDPDSPTSLSCASPPPAPPSSPSCSSSCDTSSSFSLDDIGECLHLCECVCACLCLIITINGLFH